MSNSSPLGTSFIVVVVVLICMVMSAAGRDLSALEYLPSDHILDHLSSSDEIIRMSGYGEEKLSTVLIIGTLLCTSCLSSKLQPLPVSGALVAATCNTNKKQAWEKGITDDNGEFIIDLPSHLHAIPDLHKACSIKVLWLPKDSPCQSALAADKDRVNEIVLSSVGNGIRTYTAGTLQFLHKDSEDPEACEKMTMEVAQDIW